MGVKRLVFGKASSLRGAAQRDDGEVPPSLIEADARDSWSLQHSLPSSPSVVDLIGSAASEPGMWAMSSVPIEEDGEFLVESVSLERHVDSSRAPVLHGQDLPLLLEAS